MCLRKRKNIVAPEIAPIADAVEKQNRINPDNTICKGAIMKNEKESVRESIRMQDSIKKGFTI